MPELFTTSDRSRRQFLTGTLQAAACFTYPPLVGAHADAATEGASGGAEPTSRRWALLADTHVAANRDEVYRGNSPYQNLKTVAAAIQKQAPSGAMIIGDVSRTDGQVGDYELVQSTLKPLAADTPIFLGLGNHDHRGNFHQVFSQSPQSGKRQTTVPSKHVVVIDQAPIVRLLLLDSLLAVNGAPGELGQSQLAWLKKYLSQSDPEVPVVIGIHHTFGRGGGHLVDTDALFKMVDSAPQVKAVFYGHSHRFGFTKRRGLHLVNLPPVGYAFDRVTPLGWLDTEFTRSGAALTLRTVDPQSPRAGAVTDLKWR